MKTCNHCIADSFQIDSKSNVLAKNRVNAQVDSKTDGVVHVKLESNAQDSKPSAPPTGYDGDTETADSDDDLSEDAFHMITQYNWEDDIIWNGDDLKHKVLLYAVTLY